MPKYFVSAAAAARRTDSASNHQVSRSRPANQEAIDHTQKARSQISHITVVAETRKTGVNNVNNAAIKGNPQRRRARVSTPTIEAMAGRRNAACMARSLQPRKLATPAI